MAITGMPASIHIASGAGVAFTNEATTASAVRTIYTINDAAKRAWDDAASFTVEHDIGAGYVSAGVEGVDYTIEHAAGRVHFVASEPVGALVRVSGKYLTLSVIGSGREWSLDIDAGIEDSTKFGDTWKKTTPIVKGASGSIMGWYVDKTYTQLLGGRLVLWLYTTATKHHAFYAVLSKDSLKVVVDALVDESLDFTVDGVPIYLAS